MTPTQPTRTHEGRWLWGLLLLAAVVRIGLGISEDAFLHPDAEYQGIEAAYDLVWGGGELPWEFREGIRGWVWPGFLALPMVLAKSLGLAGGSAGMSLAIGLVKVLCALVDLMGLWALWRILVAHTSARVALGFGALYALHPAFALPGTQPLIDLPSQVALLWTVEAVFGRDATWSKARSLRFGLAFGLAFMLRVQLWPALLVLVGIVLWRRRGTPPEQRTWTYGVLAALLVVAGFGAVDALTWGSPFSSLIGYLKFNLSDNLGAAGPSFGQMPAGRYWEAAGEAMPYLRVPLLLLTGAAFMPPKGASAGAPGPSPRQLAARAIGLALLAFFVPHQLLEYRVWRFVQPGLPLWLILAAMGFTNLYERVASPWTRPLLVLGLGLGLASTTTAYATESLWQTTWLHNQGGQQGVEASRALHRAYLFLSAHPDRRDFVNGVLPRAGAPGRAFLGHEVQVAHPLGRGPAPAFERYVLPADQLDATRAAGLELLWRDPKGVVVIVQRPDPLRSTASFGP